MRGLLEIMSHNGVIKRPEWLKFLKRPHNGYNVPKTCFNRQNSAHWRRNNKNPPLFDDFPTMVQEIIFPTLSPDVSFSEMIKPESFKSASMRRLYCVSFILLSIFNMYLNILFKRN